MFVCLCVCVFVVCLFVCLLVCLFVWLFVGCLLVVCCLLFVVCCLLFSKKSPTGPTERTPKKAEYLIALATSLGVRW